MGIFNKIKNAMGIGQEKVVEIKAMDIGEDKNGQFTAIMQQALMQQKEISDYFYNIKLSEIKVYTEVIKAWDDSKKVEFILFLFPFIKKIDRSWNAANAESKTMNLMASEMMQNLFKSKLNLSENDLLEIFKTYKQNKQINYYSGPCFSLPVFFKQVEYNFSDKELPKSLSDVLESIINKEKSSSTYQSKEQIKFEERIKSFLFKKSDTESIVKPSYFLGKDEFTNYANELIDKQNLREKHLWFQLISHAQKSNGGKPSQKYLKEAKLIIDELGIEKFKSLTENWYTFIINLKEQVTTHTNIYNGQEYSFNTVEFLDTINSDTLKGFVWMSSWFNDTKTIHLISKLAERSYRKIPQKGPASGAIGNACFYTLYSYEGLEGIAQLSKLKLKIKQNSAYALIEKYINEAAIKRGISPTEIEDLAVDDFGLIDHKLSFQFEDYTSVMEITGMGKSTLRWFKKDGSEQKTAPIFVKERFAEEFKIVKETQKQIDQTTSVQKERFDRMLRSNRKIELAYFQDKYLDHALLSFIVNKIIFTFSKDTESATAIYINKQWIDKKSKQIEIDQYQYVTLWHPVNSSTNEVKEWRQFLMDAQIQQPFKQAFREIYILTEAEINTKTYSNRMASHILKQHQYVTLAKSRNWKAKLIGSWDGGDLDTAELLLPDYNLKVEYWVNALDSENQINETGIWNYVTTDQVRFVNSTNNQVVDLVDVPPIAFSEAMRDVDLFVGVASVGNDPTWSDSGGLAAHRNYWQSYSFGDLSEIAKNRKEILQGLIPRLKIASVTHIEDKFVVVKGKLRTYKIHLGSTNILMTPNDQYLCIVPDRNKKSELVNVFLPFEGDNGLSVIISKAFLLANDDKITDTTITSQINR